jgi:hypothetical protein
MHETPWASLAYRTLCTLTAKITKSRPEPTKDRQNQSFRHPAHRNLRSLRRG